MDLSISSNILAVSFVYLVRILYIGDRSLRQFNGSMQRSLYAVPLNTAIKSYDYNSKYVKFIICY